MIFLVSCNILFNICALSTVVIMRIVFVFQNTFFKVSAAVLSFYTRH